MEIALRGSAATIWDQTGRVAQKRRTRAAIVAAAAQLLSRGEIPTVVSAAELANVSRATAYRYFPSQEALFVEAGLERAFAEPKNILANAPPADMESRMDLVVEHFQSAVAANESSSRAMLRFALDASRQTDDDRAERLQQVRAGRRVAMIETALEPARNQFSTQDYEKLVDALCSVVGIDGFVVTRDLRGRTADEAIAVSRWAARALVRQALADAAESGES